MSTKPLPYYMAAPGELLTVPNPKPDKVYYWPSINRPITGLDAIRRGYTVVVGKEACEELFGPGSSEYLLNAQGRIQIEEHYLMEVDLERWQAIRRAEEIQNAMLRGAPVEEFYAEFDRLKSAGITGFIETIEESRDKKEFATRESNNKVGYVPPAATPRSRRQNTA